MLYATIVKKKIQQSFDHVNNRRWDELMKSIAPNVHHRFGGVHAIGGQRHDRETLRRWFERLARVLPNLHLTINNIWVKGMAMAHHGVCAVGWERHVAERRWILPTRSSRNHPTVGQIHALDVFEDSQEVARALTVQAATGLEEAVAEPIVS